MEEKKLTRTRNAWIGGVCGGMAKYFSQDPLVWRLGAVFGTILTGFFPLTLFYIIMWIFVPREESTN